MLSPQVIDYFDYENLEFCFQTELLFPSPTIPGPKTLKTTLLELICQNFLGYNSVYAWQDSPTL